MIVQNAHVSRSVYPDELKEILSVQGAEDLRATLSHWSLLRPTPTPLHEMPHTAAQMGLARLALKDESVRSKLGSFKALGAPGALVRLVQRRWPERQFEAGALLGGAYRDLFSDLTVISATDGNHGRALTAAAQSIGCRCVIVLHDHVSSEREAAIAAYGAEIVRSGATYDESVAEAARLAADHGWQVVSDTSYEGYEAIPRDVMQGYGIIAAEVIEQAGSERPPFTHVFLQGGVGGLAAGVASYFWEVYGIERPRFVVIEPQQADCLFQSVVQGQAAHATGSVDSVMAGLACGEASPLAWRVLRPCIDAAMTISDDAAISAMQLAQGSHGDMPIVAGESGAAGFAGVAVALRLQSTAHLLGLDSDSRVLVINTEGATAPAIYQQVVGVDADTILERQRVWQQKVDDEVGSIPGISE